MLQHLSFPLSSAPTAASFLPSSASSSSSSALSLPRRPLPMLQPKSEPPFSDDTTTGTPMPFSADFYSFLDRDSGIESAESASSKHYSDIEQTAEGMLGIMFENAPKFEEFKMELGEEKRAKEECEAVQDNHNHCSLSVPEQQQMKCAVCGDNASGFHYGVCSCNGCKTFFRRTIIAARSFVCKRGGNCQFDRNGRCACRACRFQRCVRAGMDPNAIQHTPSANLTLSIARKRFQRFQCEKRGRKKHNLMVDPALLNGGFESEILATIGLALRTEEKLNRLRHSSFLPSYEHLSLHEAVEQCSTFVTCDNYMLVQKWPPRPAPGLLSAEELHRMGIKFWLYLDMYLGMEYLKTMAFFREMSRDEKVAITKSVVVPNSWLTSAAHSLMLRSNVVQYPDGLIPFRWRIENTTALERKIMIGAVPAIQRLKPDQIQTALIRWILLMNENCDGLSASSRERIGQMRSKLTRVLLVYLQNRHGASGLRHFADSMHFITALFRLQQVQRNYFVYRRYVLQNAARVPLFCEFLEPEQ